MRGRGHGHLGAHVTALHKPDRRVRSGCSVDARDIAFRHRRIAARTSVTPKCVSRRSPIRYLMVLPVTYCASKAGNRDRAVPGLINRPALSAR